MLSRKPRAAVVGLVMSVLCAVFAAAVASPGVAATKPSIRSVALHGSDEFGAVTIIVYGAKSVVVCVGSKCKPAFRSSQAGLWSSPASGLPPLRRGQSREAIVFAAANGGGIAYLVRRVIVK